MKRIARFEKVSLNEFMKDWIDTFGGSEDEATQVYNDIKLPKRATVGSAGYDFFSPLTFALKPNETIKVPTGIRAYIDEGWV